MKNKFSRLSESRKMELYQMNIEDAYNAGYADGFEAYLVTPVAHSAAAKSPNQRRAELIQRAREFVEEHERDLPGRWDLRDYGNKTCRSQRYEVDFSVKDRKVTALVYNIIGLDGNQRRKSNKPILIGRSKCHPDEVFNADIGKAIALARALEIEIPQEFMDAVQPGEPVIGSVVRGEFAPAAKVIRITREYNETRYWREGTGGYVNSKRATITDDTNAAYPEVSPC